MTETAGIGHEDGGEPAQSAGGWGGGLWAAADLITPMAIRVAATLRVADHIAAGRCGADELAAATGADPDALRRVLDHLVTARVLTRGAGRYGLTPLGARLRDDDPDGVRQWIDLDGAVGHGDLCLVELLHTVRTGEPAFDRHVGRTFWEDLSAHAGRGASFDALMGTQFAFAAKDIVAAYPWAELEHVVDVGGGNGTLLIALLAAHPGLRGTVVDLPRPAAKAERAFADAGVADRADAVPGSFFDELPAGAGGYVLSRILHDWDDEHAGRILTRCAAAVRPDGVVLVVEGADEHGAPNTEMDLRMLAYARGRERTPEQFAALGGTAGLRMARVVPAGEQLIIELRPDR